MQVIPRLQCVVCLAALGAPAVVCEHLPIYMGVTRQPRTADIFADQKWSVCKLCGCVQLSELLDPTVLYATSHTPGTVGSTWSKHHTEFAEFVARRSPKKILEIGAGTTTLATIIRQKANIESYTIVDPNVIDKGENVRIIRKLVTSNFALDEQFDTVIHSHTMEHFYNPIEDLKALTRLMTDTGQMIVSVPLIVNSVMDGFSNGLNFEHTYMTTISNFYPMFAAAGLHITSMCSFSPYNVFITASKERRPVLISNEYSSTHDIITRYYEQLVDDVDGINEQIKGKNPGSIYLFGAHIFSQSLINAGLSPVYCILDNDTTKHNQRLYGTSYDVQSPNIITSDAAPIVILRTGQYTAEITEQLRTLNPNVIII